MTRRLKLLIIGGVAGGATAAARARRLDEHAEIIVFERGEHISFANCGLPYYIGQVIKKRDALLVTTKDAFSQRYNIEVRNFSEVIAIDRTRKTVKIKDLRKGGTYEESYDKIILSPGAEPLRPPIEGIEQDNIFNLKNIPDSDRIKSYLDKTEKLYFFVLIKTGRSILGRVAQMAGKGSPPVLTPEPGTVPSQQ